MKSFHSLASFSRSFSLQSIFSNHNCCMNISALVITGPSSPKGSNSHAMTDKTNLFVTCLLSSTSTLKVKQPVFLFQVFISSEEENSNSFSMVGVSSEVFPHNLYQDICAVFKISISWCCNVFAAFKYSWQQNYSRDFSRIFLWQNYSRIFLWFDCHFFSTYACSKQYKA